MNQNDTLAPTLQYDATLELGAAINLDATANDAVITTAARAAMASASYRPTPGLRTIGISIITPADLGFRDPVTKEGLISRALSAGYHYCPHDTAPTIFGCWSVQMEDSRVHVISETVDGLTFILSRVNGTQILDAVKLNPGTQTYPVNEQFMFEVPLEGRID
jgi:hypothetical protein